MDLTSAEKLAKQLMKRHGVKLPWRFMFDDSPKALGVCHYNVGLITLNPEILYDENLVLAVLLHEIAHALTGYERVSHGPIWHTKLVSLIREHSWGI